MRAEGGLLVLLVEIAELHGVLGGHAFARRLRQRHAAASGADLAALEHRVRGVHAQAGTLGQQLAQLHAGGIDA
ncbi:hypothetical protein D3C81_1901430 [compost metagenome]